MQKKNNTYKNFDGKRLKACIVVARWNNDITNRLLVNALEALKKNKVLPKNIRVVSVAGAIEIPYALHKMALSGKYDFLVALGCVIKGETPHFEYVCKMVQEGVLEVMLEDDGIPVGFGVLTVNNMKQAKARIHVGGEAAIAAIELALIK